MHRCNIKESLFVFQGVFESSGRLVYALTNLTFSVDHCLR